MNRLPVLVVLAALLLPGLVQAQPDASSQTLPDLVREHIRTRVEAERQEFDALDVGDDDVRASLAVMHFYEKRGFRPAWIGADGPLGTVDSLLTALRGADREGLRPSTYHVENIDALRRVRSQTESSTADRLTTLELLCTDAFLVFASHLLSGQVSATDMTPSWNVPHRQADLRQLLTQATRSGTVRSAFDAVRPPQSEYATLVHTLQHYRTIAANGGWPTLPAGPTLERGSTGERVARLRQRLAVTGDLPPSEPQADSVSTEFARSLENAVIHFQERHGLDADGVVGPATRAALNASPHERIEQLVVNLERWRWMPQDLGAQHILVNIAGANLRLVENGKRVLTMRVVTGTPYRQTPVFSGEISYLVFNPYWHVPHSIATRDKLPEIKKDRRYLDRQRIKVLQGWGTDAQPIDPSTVNWARLSQNHFPYRLRQDPGPHNTLGRVKFMFPNQHNVYLHDTPTRGLFAQSERNFSSGCIRLERPIELAERLLSDHPHWSPERIQSVLKHPSAEQSVPLRTRMPVHLQYWTAWVDSDGTVHFRRDVYQRDDGVLKALNAPPPTG